MLLLLNPFYRFWLKFLVLNVFNIWEIRQKETAFLRDSMGMGLPAVQYRACDKSR